MIGAKRETDAAKYWIKQGGTPHGLDPEYAPLPITVEMRLWLRLDADLAGGKDANGLNVRPEAMQVVFPEYTDAVQAWLEEHAGAESTVSDEMRVRVARRMLRELASGRAEAYDER